MNFQKVYNTRGQKDDKGYNIKTDMFGVLTMVGGFESTGSSGAMKSKCKVKDDVGYERTVTFMGKDLPQPNMLNHRVLFACWAEEWFSQKMNKNMTSFSAWLKNANVSQTPPQNQQHQAQQPSQATNSNPVVSTIVQPDNKNGCFALAYAKDLVVAGKIDISGLPDTTTRFKFYLDNGKWDDKIQSQGEDDLPPGFNEDPVGEPQGDSDLPF